MKPLEKAIKYVGSKKRLADMIGVSPQVLDRWLENRNGVPTSGILCQKIETATRGFVKAADLYPELFGATGDKSCQANH